MGARPNITLRPLSEAERRALQRVTKASSERVDTVKRATALLAVADGQTLTQAGVSAGLSREGVAQLVERFTTRGLAVLVLASGRGRKATYHAEERVRVVQEVQRQPDREQDQTATWSLKLLQRALRRAGLPTIGATTIGRILHEEGYSLQRDRTWCDTGYALRQRKDGVYRVRDPHAQKKTGCLNGPISWQRPVASPCGIKMKRVPMPRDRSREPVGSSKAIPSCNRMKTCAMEEPSG